MFSELKVGMRLALAHLYSVYENFCSSWARVEAIGHDWVVLRSEYDNELYLLTPGDVERYSGSKLVEYPCNCEKCEAERNRTD